jgi:hypothetical protein
MVICNWNNIKSGQKLGGGQKFLSTLDTIFVHPVTRLYSAIQPKVDTKVDRGVDKNDIFFVHP